jgi:hypothetical protein
MSILEARQKVEEGKKTPKLAVLYEHLVQLAKR